jgi:hypothetical protein
MEPKGSFETPKGSIWNKNVQSGDIRFNESRLGSKWNQKLQPK